jgi:CPA2 family monovalent cation:H+ antiporter-2
MGHVPLLDELAVIAVLAVAVTVILARFRLPTVAGLLLAGALIGPYALGLVRSVHDIEVLAEVGVVLLLFTIGLEFSLSRLRHIFRQVALGGALQVGLTALAVALAAVAFGQSTQRAVVYGFVFALSSTAIVLRTLGERRELDAPHGRFIVGTLIFQDLCVVPMVLVVPLLAQSKPPLELGIEVAMAMGKAAVVVVATVAIARLVVPRVLSWVDASRSREVFLLAILGLCIGTAWLTSLAGLSLALGAFLGGMVVADTEYGHRAMGDILPLRDAFVSIFFISLGMLFDVRVVMHSPLLVLGLVAAFVFGKAIIATLAALVMRFPARAAWLAGASLAQFGEFGFVLTRLAQSNKVVDEASMSPMLAAGIASMFLTPLVVRLAPHITAGERILAPLERLIGVRSIDEADEATEGHLSDHVVVVGYGVAGRFLAEALEACGQRYVVLELNAETVRRAKERGVPAYYADATSEEALGHAHLAQARALVLLMNDPQAAQRVTETVRRVAPDVPVLIRSRYLGERATLERLGASEIVAEEVEAAVEVIARILRRLEVPRNVIDERVKEVRDATQPSARTLTIPRPSLHAQRALADLKVESVLITEESPVVSRSAVDLRLRSTTGALVVAVRRNETLLEHPDAKEPFAAGDTVYLVGTEPAVHRAMVLMVAKPT